MAEKKFVNYDDVKHLWGKILLNFPKKGDVAATYLTIENAAATYITPADVDTKITTAVDGLKNNEIKAVSDKADANETAIGVLNGDAETVGSVAKSVADAKKLVDADIDAVEEDMGNVDDLSTTNKTLVGAVNEVLAAVGTGGTAAVVTLEKSADGLTYTLKQGTATVGTIDIPKDMVVESGEVVTDPEGQEAGTYIKLVLANVAEPLYINVGKLVDIYVAKADAAQVQVAIDTTTREISATIVAGSVGTTEIADNAIVTAKIADANVTKAKLSTEVQASLGKADAAATQTDYLALKDQVDNQILQLIHDTSDTVSTLYGEDGGLSLSVRDIAVEEADEAEAAAKSYTDTEIAKTVRGITVNGSAVTVTEGVAAITVDTMTALTTEEIDAAIAAAEAEYATV